MKREARLLKDKAIESLVLAIEHFNKPSDLGRKEAVLILIDRSFELLLKSSIIHRGGRIRNQYEKETIGFEHCVRKCLSDNNVKCLTKEQALTIQIINSLRDAAQHYLIELSEQELYTYCQAGVTLFGDLINIVFQEKLRDHLPERVLPVSTQPPKDLHAIIDTDFKEIKVLVKPHSRKRLKAMAKLRAIAIVESSLQGIRSQPSEIDLKKIVTEIKSGKGWKRLFPGIAKLNLTTEGTGLNVTVRLTKKQGEPVHLVPEGTPGATIVAVKRVDELGFYSLGLNDLAKQVGITGPKALALIKHTKLQDSQEYYKEVKVGKSTFKRYSVKSVQELKRILPQVDMEKIWETNRPGLNKNKRTKS